MNIFVPNQSIHPFTWFLHKIVIKIHFTTLLRPTRFQSRIDYSSAVVILTWHEMNAPVPRWSARFRVCGKHSTAARSGPQRGWPRGPPKSKGRDAWGHSGMSNGTIAKIVIMLTKDRKITDILRLMLNRKISRRSARFPWRVSPRLWEMWGENDLKIKKKWFPGLVNFVPAAAYYFRLNLPEKFSQPGDNILAHPCKLTHLASCVSP